LSIVSSLIFQSDHRVTLAWLRLPPGAPTLLEAFEFHPAPVAQELIEAVDVLRQMNRDGSLKVPPDAPTGFIRKRWESHVFAADGIDRRFMSSA
jgi:hypothetical protein